MAATYSQDLRDRVLAACDRGMPTKSVAELFQVSPAWVRRLKQRRRETGETTPRPRGGARRIKIDRQRLAELVRQHPDATLKELRELLGVQCAESGICTALKRMGLTLKKRRSMRPNRTGRMSPSAGPAGGSNSRRSTLHDWSSSTRPGPRPT